MEVPSDQIASGNRELKPISYGDVSDLLMNTLNYLKKTPYLDSLQKEGKITSVDAAFIRQLNYEKLVELMSARARGVRKEGLGFYFPELSDVHYNSRRIPPERPACWTICLGISGPV